MRFGISWDLNPEAFGGGKSMFGFIIDEAKVADKCGVHSVWINESRSDEKSISSPSLFLTHLSKLTKNIQLGTINRRAVTAHYVRLAEEFAVLDQFSRGRAMIAYESAVKQGIDVELLHETIEFVRAAWSLDNMRYNGKYIKFPASITEDAPPGISTQQPHDPFLPMWERCGAYEPYLSIRPKPYTVRPIVHVSIEQDETLEWAAKRGVSPIIHADMPTECALERIAKYTKILSEAGRTVTEVEIAVEREINFDGPTTDCAIGGNLSEVVTAIRKLGDQTLMSHFIWQRKGRDEMELDKFTGEVVFAVQS